MIEIYSKRIGKRYQTLCKFITWVESGKKSIHIAKDYVVLDKKSYDKMVEELQELRVKVLKYGVW